MKKEWKAPEVKVLELDPKDILCRSGEDIGEWDIF